MVLNKIKAHLDELNPVRSLQLTEDEARSVRSYAFVSGKPLILVANVGEDDAGSDAPAGLERSSNTRRGWASRCIDVREDRDGSGADGAGGGARLPGSDGIHEAARDRLIRAAYSALGLICFFTVGEDEVRALDHHEGHQRRRSRRRDP